VPARGHACDSAVARSPAARCTLGVPVGPQGGVEQRGGRRGSPRKWVDGRGKKVMARRRSEAVAGSGSQRGGSGTLQQPERGKGVRTLRGS
jgi:hypothetical protein